MIQNNRLIIYDWSPLLLALELVLHSLLQVLRVEDVYMVLAASHLFLELHSGLADRHVALPEIVERIPLALDFLLGSPDEGLAGGEFLF